MSSDSGNPLPIVGSDFYKIILRPSTEFDKVRRTKVRPEDGISYVYGVVESDVTGSTSEVIEVWFDRALSRWTASSVSGWMDKHSDGLPAPTRRRGVPAGSPGGK